MGFFGGHASAAELRREGEISLDRQYAPYRQLQGQTFGNIYAAALANEGFVVLAFDASFQGASGGSPRFIEDPSIRTSDIRFGIDHLVTLPYVDENHIGAIGVCGGGGYTIHAAITDHRIN